MLLLTPPLGLDIPYVLLLLLHPSPTSLFFSSSFPPPPPFLLLYLTREDLSFKETSLHLRCGTFLLNTDGVTAILFLLIYFNFSSFGSQ